MQRHEEEVSAGEKRRPCSHREPHLSQTCNQARPRSRAAAERDFVLGAKVSLLRLGGWMPGVPGGRAAVLTSPGSLFQGRS